MNKYFRIDTHKRSNFEVLPRVEQAFRRVYECYVYFTDYIREKQSFMGGYLGRPLYIPREASSEVAAAIERAWQMGQGTRIKDDKLLESRLN